MRATERIRALNAPAKLARQMGVPAGRAVLFIQRIGYLASGAPVELTNAYCRSDLYDLVAELRREP